MVLSSSPIAAKVELLKALQTFQDLGVRFFPAERSVTYLRDNGIDGETLYYESTLG